MVCFLFEKIIKLLSLDVLGTFRVQGKVLNLGTFFTSKCANPRDRSPEEHLQIHLGKKLRRTIFKPITFVILDPMQKHFKFLPG